MTDIRELKIISNVCIANQIFEMKLEGRADDIVRTGQFLNIKLDDLYLRRPISISDFDKNGLTIVYKVVGEGTEQLSMKKAGEMLEVLMPLGNGFDIAKASGNIAVIGGGVGTPPMIGLCKALIAKGIVPTVVLGFASAQDVFYEEKFRELGLIVNVATVDGSHGTKGFVTNVLDNLDYDYYFACGPVPMLKAIHASGKKGQLSMEARMGCGFGACMGCACETNSGHKRICIEGPVFFSEDMKF